MKGINVYFNVSLLILTYVIKVMALDNLQKFDLVLLL